MINNQYTNCIKETVSVIFNDDATLADLKNTRGILNYDKNVESCQPIT